MVAPEESSYVKMLDENQRPPKVGIAEWLLVAALALCCAPALGAQPAAGIFALQQPPKNGQLRIITEQQLRLPAIAGVIIRLHCADVLKANGKLDFTWLDGQVNRARKTGKKFGLLLMGEDVAKPWLNPYSGKYNRMTQSLGARYPDCVAWFPGGSISPPGSSEEPHWSNPMPAECVPAFKNHVDFAVQAFPNASLLWPISAKDRSGRIQQCAAYLATKAPDRAMIGHNALKLKDLPPQTPTQWLDAPHNRLVVDLAKKHRMGLEFEMIGPTASNHPQRSSFPRAGTRNINDCIGQAKKLAERAGVDWGDVHVRVYPDDLAKAGAK
jgi:hypothetical protein